MKVNGRGLLYRSECFKFLSYHFVQLLQLFVAHVRMHMLELFDQIRRVKER